MQINEKYYFNRSLANKIDYNLFQRLVNNQIALHTFPYPLSYFANTKLPLIPLKNEIIGR